MYRNLRATSECFVFLLLKKSSPPPPPTLHSHPNKPDHMRHPRCLRQLLFSMAALKIASQPCRRPSWRRCLRSLGFLMLKQRVNRHPNLRRFHAEAHPFFYFSSCSWGHTGPGQQRPLILSTRQEKQQQQNTCISIFVSGGSFSFHLTEVETHRSKHSKKWPTIR